MPGSSHIELEPRVRFWDADTHELLWSNVCDPGEDLIAETRLELEERVGAGEWIVATIELGPPPHMPAPADAWKTRWTGHVKLSDDGKTLLFDPAPVPLGDLFSEEAGQ